MSASPKSGLKSFMHDFLMSARELKADLQRFRSQPDQTVVGRKHGDSCPRNKKEKDIAEGAGVTAKRQAARRNWGICEVPTNDKDDRKVIADARLMLENDNVPVVPCVILPIRGGREEGTVRAKL